jgi:preprotein translocase subunit YajC
MMLMMMGMMLMMMLMMMRENERKRKERKRKKDILREKSNNPNLKGGEQFVVHRSGHRETLNN